jgi:hypothetical protein
VDLEVDRMDLRRMRAVDRGPAPLAAGEARLRIDSFGLTANNITYAVFGEAMSYWDFFPGPVEDGIHWGRIPVWGFGDVIESSGTALEESTRVYGYFPMATELVVRPGRMDDRGFSDVAPHRDPLTSVYNRYSFVDSDPVYRREREPQQMLLWPLFVTSFVVDDFLGDHGMFGATGALVSSASAKTSIAAAFLLAGRPDIELVGLTSPPNIEFARSLGCYHQVIAYEDVPSLPLRDACYIDVAGRDDVTQAVHSHFGDRLRYSMVVGDTHWEHRSDHAVPLGGPRPTFLFAPDQITKRRREWGRVGFEQTVATAWDRFSPWTDTWMSLRRTEGPPAVEAVYRDLLEGRIEPAVGDVCALGETALA